MFCVVIVVQNSIITPRKHWPWIRISVQVTPSCLPNSEFLDYCSSILLLMLMLLLLELCEEPSLDTSTSTAWFLLVFSCKVGPPIWELVKLTIKCTTNSPILTPDFYRTFSPTLLMTSCLQATSAQKWPVATPPSPLTGLLTPNERSVGVNKDMFCIEQHESDCEYDSVRTKLT